jgi:hypothetical protein
MVSDGTIQSADEITIVVSDDGVFSLSSATTTVISNQIGQTYISWTL